MVFVCYMTLKDHVIKLLADFMLTSLSRYVSNLPILVAMITKIHVTFRVETSQDNLPFCQL